MVSLLSSVVLMVGIVGCYSSSDMDIGLIPPARSYPCSVNPCKMGGRCIETDLGAGHHGFRCACPRPRLAKGPQCDKCFEIKDAGYKHVEGSTATNCNAGYSRLSGGIKTCMDGNPTKGGICQAHYRCGNGVLALPQNFFRKLSNSAVTLARATEQCVLPSASMEVCVNDYLAELQGKFGVEASVWLQNSASNANEKRRVMCYVADKELNAEPTVTADVPVAPPAHQEDDMEKLRRLLNNFMKHSISH